MVLRSLRDGADSFDVTALGPARPQRVVLFAVGRGGNPERHLPLLEAMAARGCSVVAPHFEQLASIVPTDGELQLRARRMQTALEVLNPEALPVAGVGHSLGGSLLLAFAGAHLRTLAGEELVIAPMRGLDRLALLAPVTAFFRAPGALDKVNTPILSWAGTADTIVPPADVQFLETALTPRVRVETRLMADAGHFSFMNVPPPDTTEPLADREAFLAKLASEIAELVCG